MGVDFKTTDGSSATSPPGTTVGSCHRLESVRDFHRVRTTDRDGKSKTRKYLSLPPRRTLFEVAIHETTV